MAPHDISTDMETDNGDSISESAHERGHIEHSYCKDAFPSESCVSCSNDTCKATVKRLSDECTRLRTEIYELREKVGKLSFQQSAFKDNDNMVQDLTGLPSYAKMMVIFAFLSGFLKGGSGLSPFQCFVMTLIRRRKIEFSS